MDFWLGTRQLHIGVQYNGHLWLPRAKIMHAFLNNKKNGYGWLGGFYWTRELVERTLHRVAERTTRKTRGPAGELWRRV